MQKQFTSINCKKLVMIFGSSIAISPLILSGYYIQPAFLALFDLNSTSLYKSIHGECISRFPNLAIWLKAAFHPSFLFVSGIVATVAIMMPSFRKLFFAVWVTTAIGLCGLDLVYGALEKSLTASYLAENLVSNIIGAFALALVLTLSIWALDNFIQLSNIGNLWKYTACAIGIASIGIAISIFIYLILGMFLHPGHVNARILTTHPVSGRIATLNSSSPHAHPVSETATTKDTSTSEITDNDPFLLIPENAKLQILELQLGHDNSEFHWTKMQDDTTFSLSLYASSGCMNNSEWDDAPSDKAIYFQDNVTDVRFLGDGNMQELLVEGQQSDIVILNKKVTPFSLKQGNTDSLLDISQFLTEDANVQAKTSGDISVKLTRWLLERGEEKSHFVQRRFTLIIDGEQKQISFAPITNILDDSDLECQILHNGHSNFSPHISPTIVKGSQYRV